MPSNIVRQLAVAVWLVISTLSMSAAHADSTDAELWLGIKKDAFGSREILSGDGKFTLDAPVRAEDAAIVPLAVAMPASFANSVTKLTLIIDKNPAPVVGTFVYGPAAGTSDRKLSTRVRMDQYSEVRAIAETTDGKLYMVSRFVKASGGCSAPASKDAEEAAKTLGKIQIKTAIGKTQSGLAQEGQIAIKHPNTTGMQMDQLSRAYAPARFINKLEVKTGGKLIFSMEGGISISEDPNLRFTYAGSAADTMEVIAEDSDGTKFAGRSAASPS